MGNFYQFLCLYLWLLASVVATSRYREDGKCGSNNLAPDGQAADCEFIPPFPTCCQNNEHCGWHCDEGIYTWILVFIYLVLISARAFLKK